MALLQGYRVLLNDEQLDIFACRSGHWHLLRAQLELDAPVDRTVCGTLVPSWPRWRALQADDLRAPQLCPQCRQLISASRKQSLSLVARQ
nr:hypothetical protein [Atopomonas sediminilitoris]